jgi:hypothetical protein
MQSSKGPSIFILSVPAFANALHGPPYRAGEVRDGWVYEASRFPNADFLVHVTDSFGNRVGAPIPLDGINVTGDGSVSRLYVPASAGACDADKAQAKLCKGERYEK